MKLISKWLFIAITALAFTACSDDDGSGGPAPQPTTGTIYADRTILPATGNNPTTEWSLGGASIVIEFGILTLNASNSTTGEYLIMTGPYNEQTGVINNITTNPELGQAIYKRNTSTNAWESTVVTPNTPIFIIQIQSRDTVNKTMTGIFNTRVINPDNTEQQIIFGSGVFTDLPYVEDDGIPDGPTNVSWTADGQATSSLSGLAIANFDELTITGSDQTGSVINITIPTNVTAGTYSLGELSSAYSALYSAAGSFDFYISSTGTVTVSSHDLITNHITGTFNFTGETMNQPPLVVEITSGSFDAYY